MAPTDPKQHASNQLDTQPWYKQFWPWFIMALPASVVVAGIYTVLLAFEHKESLVDDDYYKQGKAINQSLEQQNRARDLQLQAQLNFTNDQQVLITVNGRIDVTPLQLALSHPTDASQDHSIALEPIDNDSYFGTSTAGNQRWYVKLTGIDSQQQRWKISGSIDLSSRAQTTLSP